MELAEAKSRLNAIDQALAGAPFVEFHAFERNGRILHVAVTERLRKAARRENLWESPEMMQKLFDRFLDKPDSGAKALAAALSTPLSELLPVRLVSHHMRLLGALARGPEEDWLVLVDYDCSK